MSYVYLITVDGVDRYVGKGTGQRLHAHLKRAQYVNVLRASGKKAKTSRFYNRLAKALRNGAVVNAIILIDGLTDEEAYKIEAAEVAVRSGLWNETSGGLGGSTPSPWVRGKLKKTTTKTWLNPEVREARVNGIRLVLDTPENKARAAEHAKRIWSDPDTRAKIMVGLMADQQRPEYVEDKRKAGRAASREDKVRAGQSVSKEARVAGLKRGWADPELRAKRIAALKATANRPEQRARLRAQALANAADPVIKAKALAATQTPEANENRRKAITEWWAKRKAAAAVPP